MTFNWLLVLFLAPLVGAAAVMLLPKSNPTLAKQVGIGFSLVTFLITIGAALKFDAASVDERSSGQIHGSVARYLPSSSRRGVGASTNSPSTSSRARNQ